MTGNLATEYLENKKWRFGHRILDKARQEYFAEEEEVVSLYLNVLL